MSEICTQDAAISRPPRNASEIWTGELRENLFSLIAANLSASEIAARLSTPEHTVTKNAVIGAANRWNGGFHGRRTQMPIVVSSKPLTPPPPPRGRCQYPTGDPQTGMTWCGESACERGSGAWCEKHARIVYVAHTEMRDVESR